MPAQRYLIVNADDFGLSVGVNRGIIRAHEEGIVTSASLMVRWPAAAEAAAYARTAARLGVGLHVDLAEWVYQAQEWVLRYQVVPADEEQLDSVYRLERAHELQVLCDPRVRTALTSMNIQLCSFARLPELVPDSRVSV